MPRAVGSHIYLYHRSGYEIGDVVIPASANHSLLSNPVGVVTFMSCSTLCVCVGDFR